MKLIRGDLRNPQIQLIDLSTIEGVKQSNLLLQANDIIYVEPTRNLSESILVKISPIVGLFTTIILVMTVLVK